MTIRKMYERNSVAVDPEVLGLFDENPEQICMLLISLRTVVMVKTSPASGLKQDAITPAVLSTLVTLPFRVK